MQPELLSPEKEENQPQSSDPEEAQPETPPAEETKEFNPSPAKKHSRFNLAYLALGALVFLLFAAIAWVGYWTYNLGTELTTTQQQLAALQAEQSQLQTDYETIKSENEKLNNELTQSKADLEKANTELAAAQSDLTKSQDQGKSLNAKIDKASKLAAILYAFSTVESQTDFFNLDKLIKESKNQAVIAEWKKISTEEGFRNFLEYLILATRDSLK
jgi:septal ring factor EnvC (AmiA/AmiB activator)